MSESITVASAQVLADMRTYVTRASALGCEHVRLTVRGNALAMTVGVLWRESLLESTPTILGMRVTEIVAADSGRRDPAAAEAGGRVTPGAPVDTDAVVELAQLRDRIARDDLTFVLPTPIIGIIWAGVSPPLDGWSASGSVRAEDLNRVAREGIAEVAAVSGQGAKIVNEVRRTVWSRSALLAEAETEHVPESGASMHTLPAGVGLVGYGMGFLADGETADVATVGAWTRLTTRRGHILSRSPQG